MLNLRIPPAFIVLTVMLAACSPAQSGVTEAWARPAAAGGNGAVYFHLRAGSAPIEIIGASTAIASQTRLHQTIHSGDGVVQMQPLPELSLAAGESIVFEPGGLHVMLVELKQPLRVGDTVVVNLYTSSGETILVNADVRQQ